MNQDLLIIHYKDGTSQTLKMYHLLVILPLFVFLIRWHLTPTLSLVTMCHFGWAVKQCKWSFFRSRNQF